MLSDHAVAPYWALPHRYDSMKSLPLNRSMSSFALGHDDYMAFTNLC